MRLTSDEIQIIKKVILGFIPQFTLYLHGSRIDDKLKGGDIDLFLIIPDEQSEVLKSKKHYLNSQISLHMREQRVDLIIISESEAASNSFFKNSAKIQLCQQI